jgi:hypothetical protein
VLYYKEIYKRRRMPMAKRDREPSADRQGDPLRREATDAPYRGERPDLAPPPPTRDRSADAPAPYPGPEIEVTEIAMARAGSRRPAKSIRRARGKPLKAAVARKHIPTRRATQS